MSPVGYMLLALSAKTRQALTVGSPWDLPSVGSHAVGGERDTQCGRRICLVGVLGLKREVPRLSWETRGFNLAHAGGQGRDTRCAHSKPILLKHNESVFDVSESSAPEQTIAKFQPLDFLLGPSGLPRKRLRLCPMRTVAARNRHRAGLLHLV